MPLTPATARRPRSRPQEQGGGESAGLPTPIPPDGVAPVVLFTFLEG